MRRREMLKAAVAATGGLAAASLMRPVKAKDFLKPDADRLYRSWVAS